MLIAADLWRMALAAVLPLVDQHLAAVYAVAFGLAAGTVFFNPAANSVLPSLVDDELVAANSGLWSAAVISQIALAPLAGVLVSAVGVTPAFLVNAASFAVSALLLVGLRQPGRPAATAAGSWLGQVGDGARLLVHDRLLRLLGLVQRWQRCRPERPAPSWSSWPAANSRSVQRGSACCWPPSGSAPPSARCC